MSDNEGHSGAPPSDEDLSLPKATVAKMISGTLASIMDYAHSFLTLFIYGCVFRIELLPKDVTCAKDTRDLVIECCVGEVLPLITCLAFVNTVIPEFIHLISSEANEICEKESKKTIAPEHIISALEVRHRIHGVILDIE